MTTQTKTTWKKVKLGDVAEIESGGTPSSSKPEYWDNGDICWATLPDLKNKYIFDTQRKITALGLKNSSAKLLPIDSVIFSSRATIGEISITKVETSTNQGSKNFICDPKEIDIPNLLTQKQIADVLSAYDDLIENNTKRIKILEEIAQAIYKEWFVFFRFPRLRRGFGGQAGHEKAKSRSERSSATGIKMVDSKTEFSKIPEGWGVGKLSDLATITMGQSPSSDFYSEIGDGSPFHQGVTNFGFRFPVTNTFSTEGTRKAVAGDILFSVRAPVGRINVADRNMIIGRGLAALKSASGYQSFLLYNLKHLFQTEDLIGGGAIFASVTKDDLSNFPVIIPDIKMIEKFESIVRSIDQMILSISNELSVLRNSRDSLLPKLVGGEVGVKNL